VTVGNFATDRLLSTTLEIETSLVSVVWGVKISVFVVWFFCKLRRLALFDCVLSGAFFLKPPNVRIGLVALLSLVMCLRK
jgi:hypothetical protein